MNLMFREMFLIFCVTVEQRFFLSIPEFRTACGTAN
jgi:hypothetical protein